jgi:hypothetical protein
MDIQKLNELYVWGFKTKMSNGRFDLQDFETHEQENVRNSVACPRKLYMIRNYRIRIRQVKQGNSNMR